MTFVAVSLSVTQETKEIKDRRVLRLPGRKSLRELFSSTNLALKEDTSQLLDVKTVSERQLRYAQIFLCTDMFYKNSQIISDYCKGVPCPKWVQFELKDVKKDS